MYYQDYAAAASSPDLNVVILENSSFHQRIADFVEWMTAQIPFLQRLQHQGASLADIEAEGSFRPTVSISDLPGRRNDIGFVAFQQLRQSLGDAVIRVQKSCMKQPQLLDADFSKKTCNDFFYQHGNVRQRVFEDANQISEWRRKELLHSLPPFDLAFAPDKIPLSFYFRLKHEKPLTMPLPSQVAPIFSRRKTTYRYQFQQHPYCILDLSEIQNIKYSQDSSGVRATEDGPLVYEFELELTTLFLQHILKLSASDTSSKKQVQFVSSLYPMEIWDLCGDVISQVHEVLGIPRQMENN